MILADAEKGKANAGGRRRREARGRGGEAGGWLIWRLQSAVNSVGGHSETALVASGLQFAIRNWSARRSLIPPASGLPSSGLQPPVRPASASGVQE